MIHRLCGTKVLFDGIINRYDGQAATSIGVASIGICRSAPGVVRHRRTMPEPRDMPTLPEMDKWEVFPDWYANHSRTFRSSDDGLKTSAMLLILRYN
jgi:hypothetical protein